MIEVELRKGEVLTLEHAVFDVNGTLTRDGHLVDGVIERMHALSRLVEVHLLTANTYGTQDAINVALAITKLPNMRATILNTANGAPPEDEQKAEYIAKLGVEHVAAIGNGKNDRLMLKKAALGIAVIGPEGTAADALEAALVIAPDPLTAIDLLLHPIRLKATLRI